MRYRLKGFVLAFLLAVLAGNLNAQETYAGAVGYKLGAGLSNVVLPWVELPKCMINGYNNSHYDSGVPGAAWGLISGVAFGIGHTVGRLFTGALDVITFPVPTKPIPQPAFVWQDFRGDTTYGEAFILYNE